MSIHQWISKNGTQLCAKKGDYKCCIWAQLLSPIAPFSLAHAQRNRAIMKPYASDIQLHLYQVTYLKYECVNEGAISHFSLFQGGRAKEKELQGDSSAQKGKGWHEGPRSLVDSNILLHSAPLGHWDQSGYRRIQCHMAVEGQSPSDNKSLEKEKSHKINQLQREWKINQGYYSVHCSFQAVS